jgi:hypothetical protein
LENLKERDHFGRSSRSGKILLKWIVHNWGEGVNWNDLA